MKFNPHSHKQDPQDTKNIIIFVVVVLALLVAFDNYVMQPKFEKMRQAQDAEFKKKADALANKDALESEGSGTSGQSEEAQLKAMPRLSIQSEKLEGSINLLGGQIDDLRLTQYYKTLEQKEPVELLHPKNAAHPFYVEFGWVPKSEDVKTPDKKTQWKIEGESKAALDNIALTPQNPITLIWDNGQGLVFKRKISLDENYLFTIEQKIINSSEKSYAFHPYALISRHGLPEELQNIFILHEGPIAYFNQELFEYSYKDLRGSKETFRKSARDGWIGITDKYWMTALLPDQKEQKTYRFVHKNTGNIGDKPRFQVDMMAGSRMLSPGGVVSYENHLFAGAKKIDILESYEESLNIPHFDLAVDFGWFYFITKPFFQALNYLFKLTGNFGIAIILFTIFLRALVFPLANKSYKSFARLKQISPKIMELRDQYKDDKQQLQQELVKLYGREKVNPLAGCFPILIQIPIFFSLYKVLFITIEMRHAPFFGWINDLSAPDPTSIFNLFGLLPFGVPGFLQIGVWPCLMLVALLAQQRLNPPPQDPMQRQIMMIFPFVITFIMSRFAAGLVVYWSVSAMLAIVQQYIIMRRMGVEVHLFKRSKQEQELDEAVEQGPDIHPGVEYAEEQFEEAMFDDDESTGENKPQKPVSRPKPKKKKKR